MAQVVLARWLQPEEYGAFALGFAIFLLFGAVHTAVLSDPMLIFGGGRFQEMRPVYLSFLLNGHLRFSTFAVLLLGLAALVAHSLGFQELSEVFLSLCLVTPVILLAWLLRRAFYLEQNARQAASASGLFAISLLISVWGVLQLGWLSPVTAYLCMGLSSLVLIGVFFKKIFNTAVSPTKSQILAMAGVQWEYARWASITALLIWVPLNIFFLLPYSQGLQTTAELRAVNNFLTPLIQSTAAITTLTLPSLARQNTTTGKAAVRQRTWQLALGFCAVGIVYWLFLAIFHKPLFSVLYADNYPLASANLLLAGGIPLLFGIAALLENGLRAMEQPKPVLTGYLTASTLSLSVGVWLALQFQVPGAILGQLVAFAGLIAILAFALTKAASE